MVYAGEKHSILVKIKCLFFPPPAIVVYRLPWTWKCSKLMMKFIHAGLNVLAFILAIISLVAVFDFHNMQNIPNMYSLHSWVGLAAVILFSLQVTFLWLFLRYLSSVIRYKRVYIFTFLLQKMYVYYLCVI